jgi:hypothetical protein
MMIAMHLVLPMKRQFGSTLAKIQDSTISLMKPYLASDSILASKLVVSKCKRIFDGVNSLVSGEAWDGTMAKGIAEAFPHMDCTVFDLPHVVSDLQSSMGTGLAMIIHNEFNYEK